MTDQTQYVLIFLLVMAIAIAISHLKWVSTEQNYESSEDTEEVLERDDEPQPKEHTTSCESTEESSRPTTESDKSTVSYTIAAGLLGAGITLLSIGIVIWVRPSLVPPELTAQADRIRQFGDTPFFVVGGIIAMLSLTLVFLTSRTQAEELLTDVPAPEEIHRPAVPMVGNRVDEQLANLDGSDIEWRDMENAEGMCAYLRELVIESLVADNGWEHEHAERVVNHGEWTDRKDVAAFVSESDTKEVPIRYALRDWLSAESTIKRRARRTIQELDAITENDDP